MLIPESSTEFYLESRTAVWRTSYVKFILSLLCKNRHGSCVLGDIFVRHVAEIGARWSTQMSSRDKQNSTRIYRYWPIVIDAVSRAAVRENVAHAFCTKNILILRPVKCRGKREAVALFHLGRKRSCILHRCNFYSCEKGRERKFCKFKYFFFLRPAFLYFRFIFESISGILLVGAEYGMLKYIVTTKCLTT